MSHFLYRIGNFAGRHPWRVIAAWIFVAGAIFMLNASQGGEYDESFSLPAPSRSAPRTPSRIASRRRRSTPRT